MFSPFFGGSPYGYDVEETIPSLYGRRPMSRQQQAAYRAQQEQEMLRRQELLRQQELQRQQQALRQQQQRQAQYEAQLKKQAAEQERRRQALIKYTAAATVIQRWFRAARAARAARLARATALKRAAAGRVVLRRLRSVAAVREAKRLAAQLRKLAALRAEVDKFVAEHAGAALSAAAGAATTPTTVPKALLAYADRLEKLLLKLDNISHGSDLFRASRKALAAHIQTLLAAADARRHQIEHDAEDLQAGEQLCKLLDGTFDRIEEERLRRDRETTASLTLQRWWRASSRALAARRVARIAAETASAAADFAKQLRALQARLQATPHAAAAPDHQRAAHQIQTWLQQLGN